MAVAAVPAVTGERKTVRMTDDGQGAVWRKRQGSCRARAVAGRDSEVLKTRMFSAKSCMGSFFDVLLQHFPG
jgi:hypothetical protein